MQKNKVLGPTYFIILTGVQLASTEQKQGVGRAEIAPRVELLLEIMLQTRKLAFG